MNRNASDALLVRSVAYGESDLIVTLVTATDGKLSAMVRGGRKSTRRVGGALEPFHTMHVALDDRGGELVTLREARLERVRARLAGDLDGSLAAGKALRWARDLFPPRTPEPEGYAAVVRLLDTLDAREPGATGAAARAQVDVALAIAAFALLAAVGYGIDLDGCVRCGRPCPEGRAAAVDTGRGGLVCQACGGAQRHLSPSARSLARQLSRGEAPATTTIDADELGAVLALAEEAIALHGGVAR